MEILFLLAIVIIGIGIIAFKKPNENNGSNPDKINLNEISFNEFDDIDKKKIEKKRQLNDLEYERAAMNKIMYEADTNGDGEISGDESWSAEKKVENLKRDLKTFKIIDSLELKNEMSKERINIEAIRENGNDIEIELFKEWCKEIFRCIKINDNENISIIKPFLSVEIFNNLISQIKRLEQDDFDFKSEGVLVKEIKIIDYGKSFDKEMIRVLINASLKEYIIDNNTGEIIKGNDKETKEKNFIMTFLKKDKEETKEGFITNCPNCEATIHQTELGKCRYCGTVIFPIRYNWTLTKFETI